MELSALCPHSMLVPYQMLNLLVNPVFLMLLKGKWGYQLWQTKVSLLDLLQKIDVELNIPAFLKEKQLSAEDVTKGRKIASVRIHVERAIGRIKKFQILKGTIPISMSRLSNQIVFVRAFLTNFLPALVPLHKDVVSSDINVENYFDQLTDSDSDTISVCDDSYLLLIFNCCYDSLIIKKQFNIVYILDKSRMGSPSTWRGLTNSGATQLS